MTQGAVDGIERVLNAHLIRGDLVALEDPCVLASVQTVTNRAHNPTGASLSDQRAEELRTMLNRHPDVLVIEDDHPAIRVNYSTITSVSATDFARTLAAVDGASR